MYDVIGDIHGYADPLKRLLTKLGYKPSDSGWQHPERQAVFLGDFVDRGPAQVEVIQIAREMVECGHALAVMGNHEFNAVSFATPHPDNSGEHLRKHTTHRRADHQRFLDQLGEGSEQYADAIKWFATLPLFLELEGLRIVHATWCGKSIQDLAPYLTANNQLTPEAWAPANAKGDAVYNAVENLIKGYELKLPNGLSFKDKGGTVRTMARLRWWEDRDLLLKDALIIPDIEQLDLPDKIIEASSFLGYDNAMPVLFGHYWWSGPVGPLTDTVACLDYSIANKHQPGQLVAYRWDGETKLRQDRFVAVE
ncbi:Calcineurin-like phosphoesterase [Ectothiorhodosinus mongolicus]|uniref:Calcineurin-like phosphoesterase n=1 Tax=Ectothiorhodosinus mongolicus TaxID=233100 RepID=A0A1R3W4D8_9GAMM|nr:metallophosphoesterase [Ectothiorhodosinus mongolicus]ULX57476.1 metallophosphoesterase [Ectothiorhodosinus mongolicus]SIT72381.1 Calcineurin-like phosphoesterase [Ectothiorhodosinus mongolicus]